MSLCSDGLFGNLDLSSKNRLELEGLLELLVRSQDKLLVKTAQFFRSFATLGCQDHPLQRELELLPSRRRARAPV